MKSFLSLLLCVACTAISLGAEAQQVAFIKSISGSDAATSLDADYVQMLTGKAAVTAARRAGEAEYDLGDNGSRDTTWYVPNDYYILNENTRVRRLTLAPTAKILLARSGGSTLKAGTVSELKRAYKGPLFKLTISGTSVTRVEEVYTP